jgi:subtilisin family serine protease
MNLARTVSWNDSKKIPLLPAFLALTLSLFLLASASHAEMVTQQVSDQLTSVIVRALPGHQDQAAAEIEGLGGTVTRRMDIIHGFAAEVPRTSLPSLINDPSITVTPNKQIHLLHAVDGFDGAEVPGSMHNAALATKARVMWHEGATGRGVDIALIDSGVVPVTGLNAPGKVINGPDLTWESTENNLRHLDTYGHGTHMAGIIAGRDPGVNTSAPWSISHDSFVGIAPDARIVNIKVADAMGRTDVSQVLAAIDWVVQHRTDNGMNIRVLNLSFGTDGVQNYVLDPLTYAAEVAWRKGIVVVVAAGNSGFGNSKLNNPAYDPYVIAVGASDTRNTPFSSWDDTVPPWSSRGDGTRNPDLVAPGKSIVSLRDPGSYLDTNRPEGRVNSRFTRGSGTSQAAAIVSGAAALLLDDRPYLTPDQVKRLMRTTARDLPSEFDEMSEGRGTLDIRAASNASVGSAVQTWPVATGLGSLNAARGSAALDPAKGPVEVDLFGNEWNSNSWSSNSWSSNSWSGGSWSSNSWSGAGWLGGSWNSNSWSSNSWSSNSWSSNSWSSNSWSSNSWSSNSWSSNSWSSNSWSSNSWSSNSWSSNSWS